ncbi:MAG: hypothetical protein U1F70_05360 [Candidatus Competibacteraceae bacterium]
MAISAGILEAYDRAYKTGRPRLSAAFIAFNPANWMA